MNTDIRIPLTAEQKHVLAEAVSDEPGGMAAWARQILIHAARERISRRSSKKAVSE
jgi:hypothetical protein